MFEVSWEDPGRETVAQRQERKKRGRTSNQHSHKSSTHSLGAESAFKAFKAPRKGSLNLFGLRGSSQRSSPSVRSATTTNTTPKANILFPTQKSSHQTEVFYDHQNDCFQPDPNSYESTQNTPPSLYGGFFAMPSLTSV